MKIYIALFTTLIAAGHFTNVSAADAAAPADGASHPHLRALVEAPPIDCRKDYHCDRGEVCSYGVCVEVEVCLSGCNNDNDCGCRKVCTISGGSGCSGTCETDIEATPVWYTGRCIVSEDCLYDEVCSGGGSGGSGRGCTGTCKNGDEIEVSSLRASILKEE
eukprot:scaffold4802_cov96-Skeletonema_dohrnii-CCMP3373.AAC.3